MTVNHLVTGSNPVSGATKNNTPKNPIRTKIINYLAPELTNYDTLRIKADTKRLRLYKVNSIYYYRRRIKDKLVRVSLKTRDIRTAFKRKKILDLMETDEMFKLETKDFKLMFEYDTEEELRIALESIKNIQIEKTVSRFKETKREMEKEQYNDIDFEKLKNKFILKKKESGKVSPESITAYTSTFNFLTNFFKDEQIKNIDIDKFEEFQKSLDDGTRKNKTINKHIKYLKSFIKFAVERKYLESNNVEGIFLYDELKDEQERKLEVENYTDEEMLNIINFKYNDKKYNTIFKILAHTGMRVSEVWRLKNSQIKYDAIKKIKYIDINEGKSKAAIRKVPIHKDILKDLEDSNLPFFNISKNAFTKRLRARIYKVIEKDSTENVHTIRATFIEKALEKYPDLLNVIQEIVGHEKSSKDALTIDTYAKGHPIELKNEIINSVIYK